MNVIGSGCAKRHAMAGASMRGAGLLGMILFALSVSDAHAADARKGETLAKRWCAACHVVAKDQPRGSEPAPPFASIASRDNFDAAKVALFLLAPHPLMPDMNLTRDEAANLAAYIAAQR